MKVTFGNLIHTVSPLIEAGIPSLKELIKYLRKCFQDMRPQLTNGESFDDVMEIVQDKCTIINVCCLEAIVDHYNIAAAKQHIEEFKSAVDTFCEKIKTNICFKQNFKGASFSHNLTCETIEFVLEWEADKYTLRDIKHLLSKAFGDMAKSVQVRNINDGNSIIVTCYAPPSLMDFLLTAVERNLNLLKENGMIKLTFGYHTIYDKRQRDEVRDE